MKKLMIALALAALLLAFVACAARTGTTGSADAMWEATAPITDAFTETAEESVIEIDAAAAVSEMPASTAAAVTTTLPVCASAEAATAKAVAAIKQPVASSTTAKPATALAPMVPPPATAAQAATTTRYVPPQTAAATATTAAPPQRQTYTEADYGEIIAAVRKYADAKTKVRFLWNPGLSYDGPVSYHDVINLSLYGKEFVISELKYNCDLTETQIAGGSGGVPGDAVYYNIVYFEYQGDMMFVHLYS